MKKIIIAILVFIPFAHMGRILPASYVCSLQFANVKTCLELKIPLNKIYGHTSQPAL